VDDLTPNQNYFFFVTAYNTGNLESLPSNVIEFVPTAPLPPVPNHDSLVVAEDTPASITLSAVSSGDSAARLTLTYSITQAPRNGTLVGTSPNLTYQPNANYTGPDSFQFTVSQGSLTSEPGIISIEVSPINDPPVAVSRPATAVAGVPLQVPLQASDVEGSPLAFSITRAPSNGSLSGTGSTRVYTARSDFSGTDFFEFTASDGAATSVAARITIDVKPAPNTAPIAQNQTRSLAEDSFASILLNATDAEGNPLTYVITQPPVNGTLSGTPPSLTYTPFANFNGSDSFRFTANDGKLTSAPALVSISVTEVNDTPVASAQSASGQATLPIEIQLKATDVENSPLAFAITRSPSGGSLTGTGSLRVYTARRGFSGTDSFDFTASDGSATSTAATVTITVEPAPNARPLAITQSINLNEDSEATIVLGGSDEDNDTLSFAITRSPTNGTLSGTAPNLSYRPSANFNGSDSFDYCVHDGKIESETVTVLVEVTAVNDTPVASPLTFTLAEGASQAVELQATDADNDNLTYSITVQPTRGQLIGTPPSLQYLPNPGATGADSFGYQANDGKLTSAQATVTLTIIPKNNPPVARSASIMTVEDRATSIVLAGSDLDLDPLTFTITQGPARGILTGTLPNLVYQPETNYFGLDSFQFTVSDGKSTSAPATVSIRVSAVNDKPFVTEKTIILNEDTATPFVIEASDVDDTDLRYTITTQPSFGTLSGTAPNLTYHPRTNYSGADIVRISVSDRKPGGSSSGFIRFTVNPVNDAPIALAGRVSTIPGGSVAITLGATDVERSPLTYTVTTLPRNGTISGTPPSLTYRPRAGFTGVDSLSFTANDGTLTSTPARVSIQVGTSSTISEPTLDPSFTVSLSRDEEQAVLSFPVVSGVTYRVEGNALSGDSAATWELLGELTSPIETIAEVPTAALADGTSRYFRVTATSATGTKVTEPFGIQRFALSSGAKTYTSAFQGMRVLGATVAAVSGSSVELLTSNLTDGQCAPKGPFASHALVIPGTSQWWPILGNTAGQVTVDAKGSDLSAAIATGSLVEVVLLPTAQQIIGTAGTADSALQPGDFADFVNGNGTVSTLECRSSDSGAAAYFLHDSGSVQGPWDPSAISFLPGQPIQVQKVGAAGTLWFLGRVQSNPLTPYRVGSTETNGPVSQ
jgi:hypothetical protein